MEAMCIGFIMAMSMYGLVIGFVVLKNYIDGKKEN
jgi:hypothetical protein